jgi:hypothetical protein
VFLRAPEKRAFRPKSRAGEPPCLQRLLIMIRSCGQKLFGDAAPPQAQDGHSCDAILEGQEFQHSCHCRACFRVSFVLVPGAALDDSLEA